MINAVQNRACRFYLGLGKYAPNAAVNRDTGWLPPIVKQWKGVLNHWFKLNSMDSSRLNSFVFKWSNQIKYKTKNWCFRIDKVLLPVFNTSVSIGSSYTKSKSSGIINEVQSKLFDTYKTKWLSIVSSDSGVSGTQTGNKLRKYKLFKLNYETEPYVKTPILSRCQRSALAKFRCGVASLKTETGRYSQTPIC